MPLSRCFEVENQLGGLRERAPLDQRRRSADRDDRRR
jgi:hypothetical protein